jgi:hypothetical protein
MTEAAKYLADMTDYCANAADEVASAKANVAKIMDKM